MSRRRRLIGNSLSVIGNQAAQNATSLVLNIAIARILGVYALGQYNLAYTYYFIFMTIASNGFKVLFTREMARKPESVKLYIVSGTALQLGFAAVIYIMLAGLVLLLPYEDDTARVCLLVGLALIPYSISNVTEAAFQAIEKMHIIAISTVPVYIARLGVMIALMASGADVESVAITLVLSEVFIVVIEWLFALRLFGAVQWTLDWVFIRQTMRQARTFVAIESIATFRSRIQTLILSLVAGEAVVGLYSAAMQLIRPFQLVATSVSLAVFPSLSKSRELSREQQQALTERAVSVLLMLALPLIVGFYFVGGPLLVAVYGDPAFSDAAGVLHILSLMMVALALTRNLSLVLVANRFERFNLIVVTVAMVASTALSVLLIGAAGLNGAALASTTAELIVAIAFAYFVARLVFPLRIMAIMRLPLAVTLVMTVVFVLLEFVDAGLIVTVLVASAAYVMLMAGIVVQMVGGFRMLSSRFRARFSGSGV